MLLVLNQFLTKQAIKSPLYLLNPPVIPQDAVVLPRYSVIHHLDTKQNNHFPVRDIYYLQGVDGNKKIPIAHVEDLDIKNGIASLDNKYLPSEIRKWHQTNLKEFRAVNILEMPNKDIAIPSILNYNLLKDLYKYKNSAETMYNRFTNLSTTYWNHVKSAIAVDNESIHIVSINLPNNIPNYVIIDTLLKFSPAKLSRVANDFDLLQIIDLYKWLLNSTRTNSTMVGIDDEDAKKIIVEFKYKGYSTFLPLWVLRSVSKESTLETETKVAPQKVQRIFIVMLHKAQDKINALLEEENIPTPELTDKTVEEVAAQIKSENDEDDEDQPIAPETVITAMPNIAGVAKIVNIENVIEQSLNSNDLDNIIDLELDKFETDNDDTNRMYEQSIIRAEREKEPAPEDVPIKLDYAPERLDALLNNKTTDDKFNKYISEAVEFKTLTSSEIRSLKKTKENRTLLKSPYDKETKLDHFKIVNPTDIEMLPQEMALNVDVNLVSDDLKKEVINTFDRKYLKRVLHKDIVACVSNLENADLIIKDYSVERNRSSLGNYEIHKLTIKPFNAKESTVYFRIPMIDKEGEFVASGIKYKMRKQETDLPIRKISETRVALTSNYGKLFIFRTERKANDPFDYIANFIRNNYIDGGDLVTKIIPGGRQLNHLKLPTIYHFLSSQFTEIHTTKCTFLLNYKERGHSLDMKVLNEIEGKHLTFAGYLPNKHILVVDLNNIFYDYSSNMAPVGTIDEILELDSTKIPKPFSAMKIIGDNIPLGVCMAYYLGLDELIAVTGTKATVLESSKQYKPNRNEIVLKFSDYKLILEVPNKETELLFNGFLFYKDFIKQHSIREFNYKDIYLNLLEFRDGNLIHIKELNLLQDLFLDPVTVDVLKSINEPTDYLRLLLRANQLLSDFSYPDINDPAYSRIRGYDRIPGLMYKALSESIRDYKFKNGNRSKVELDPYKVWNYITQDSTVKITEDINPILDVKESESVTLSGADGLSKDATPKMMRRYHKNDIGLISEATVDSSDVALNISLSPYAKLKNVRGLVDMGNTETLDNKAKVYSTSVMLAPMSEYDDPKRQNFVSIQNSHTIFSQGYVQPIMRTEFEYVMPYKVGKLYCTMAEEDGVVVDKSDKLLTVKYKSGETESIPIGNKYGRMEGSVYPHSLVSDLVVGTKFKKDQYLVYNENFFEKDWLNPSRLVMKFGRNVSVALTMNEEVFEDSSAISAELSKTMSTTIVKEKIFVFEFKKNIINVLSEGTPVDPNSILFTVLDENTDYSNLSDSTVEMLQNLAALSPKAKVNGIIDRYEVKYNGEVADMSPTIKKLVTRLDRMAYDESKNTEYEVANNRVTSEYRSEGKNLNIDTLELKVFVKININQAVGDKGVFANQMKSVISDVYNSTIVTESGQKVDAMFSYQGILGRIVNSPILIGTTNRLTKHGSIMAANIYFGN